MRPQCGIHRHSSSDQEGARHGSRELRVDSEASVPAQRSTLHAQRSTLNAQRSTLNAQRSTLNAPRSTLNAQRSTLNAQRNIEAGHLESDSKAPTATS